MFRLMVTAIAASLCLSTASGQLIVANDQTTPAPTIWELDVTNALPNPPRSLVSGSPQGAAWGMAYDRNSSTLYWNNGGSLFKATYTPSGTLTHSLIGTLTLTTGGTFNVTGMAYNPFTNKLYGYRSVTAPGFYEIDPGTALGFLVAATPTGTDFGGFDFDPVTNAYYVLNDGTGLSGRGLYKFANIAAPTPSLVTPYPGTETDIDGLAVGNGRAFMVNDVPAQGIYVFNLVTNAYEPTLASPFTGTNGIFSAAAFVPEPATVTLTLLGLLAMRRRR